MIYLLIPLGLFVLWVLGVIAATALLHYFYPESEPFCSVFGVHIPQWVHELPHDDRQAIILHEEGHWKLRHAHTRLVEVILYLRGRPLILDEFEADDYVIARGFGMALARMLDRRSDHPDDIQRVARILAKESLHDRS